MTPSRSPHDFDPTHTEAGGTSSASYTRTGSRVAPLAMEHAGGPGMGNGPSGNGSGNKALIISLAVGLLAIAAKQGGAEFTDDQSGELARLLDQHGEGLVAIGAIVIGVGLKFLAKLRGK